MPSCLHGTTARYRTTQARTVGTCMQQQHLQHTKCSIPQATSYWCACVVPVWVPTLARPCTLLRRPEEQPCRRFEERHLHWWLAEGLPNREEPDVLSCRSCHGLLERTSCGARIPFHRWTRPLVGMRRDKAPGSRGTVRMVIGWLLHLQGGTTGHKGPTILRCSRCPLGEA